jgi:hypothetical protein
MLPSSLGTIPDESQVRGPHNSSVLGGALPVMDSLFALWRTVMGEDLALLWTCRAKKHNLLLKREKERNHSKGNMAGRTTSFREAM